MNSERWNQIKGIFDQAVECEPASRQDVVRRLSGDDEELCRQVEALLISDQTDSSLLENPILGAAAARNLDPLIGRNIGPYRVIREIGRGGMGRVYLAQRTDDQFRRRVALKAVDPALVDRHTLHRFENERQTLASLDHPNIIKLIDGGTTEDGLPWLVMDYVEGETIDQYCETHRLTVAERLKLFRTVCAAVHYAHQNLVIHRDLKPSNILITPEGIPKLLDFGIAKLLRPEFLPHTVGYTQTNLQPMTPQFASPEQIRGLPITTASDIYSLGVLLYAIITGKPPYVSGSLMDLQRAICETEPVKPSTALENKQTETSAVRGDRISGDLDVIVLMAMRKEPQRRYASAEHLSEDIRRLLEGHPVAARKDTWTYRVSKLVSRRKTETALTAAAALALVITGLFAYREFRQSERRTHELRQFAQVVLSVDDGLRTDLTATRASMLAKAVASLDNLAREAGGDPDLQKDLIRAYSNMADVQGNIYAANLGQMTNAEGLYHKALAIAMDLQRANPNAANTGQVAACNMKLGDMLFARGDFTNALAKYRGAQQASDRLLLENPTDRQTLENLFFSWSKIGNVQQRLGDLDAGLESYHQCVDRAEKWIVVDPSKRVSLAWARQQVALLAMKTGEAGSAEPELRKSLEIYQQVYGTSQVPAGRRRLALAFLALGQAQQRTGKLREALASMKRGLEFSDQLVDQDPKNRQFQTDLFTISALAIDLELLNKEREAAHFQTQRALRFLQPLVEDRESSPYALFYCAWILTRTPFRDLQNHRAALDYAKRGAEATHNSDPDFLELLARAYTNAGYPQLARETIRKALTLIPAPKPGRPITELQTILETASAKLK